MALTLVLGYDGSDCARKALSQTAALVKEAGGATVIVLNAYQFSIGYVPLGMTNSPLMMTAEYGEHIDLLRRHGEEVVAEAAAELKAAGAAVEQVVVDGDAVDALLEVAADRRADLIIVGSHGEGAVRAAFLGSVAIKLLQHSEIPVLVVPQRRKQA